MPLLTPTSDAGSVNWFGRSPAMYLAILQSLLALLVAFGAPWTVTINDAIMIILSGVVTIATALLVRPVDTPLTLGTIKTIVLALAAFGFHATDVQLAALLAALAAIIAYLTKADVTPVAKIKARR